MVFNTILCLVCVCAILAPWAIESIRDMKWK